MAGFIFKDKKTPRLGSKSGGFESATTPHESDRSNPQPGTGIDAAPSNSGPIKDADRYQKNVQNRTNPPVERATSKKLFGGQGDKSDSDTQAESGGSGGFKMPSYPGGLGGLVGAARGMGAFFKQRKKQTGVIGAIIGLIVVLVLGGGGLSIFKLVHIREVLNDVYGKRMDHAAGRRVGHLWRVVADKNGNVIYAKTGNPLRDRLYNTKSSRIVEDLKARGLDVKLDPDTHKIMVDGRPLGDILAETGGTGKLAERRAFIRAKLSEAYPESGFLRRSIRAQRVFRIYGIKRTFFENSREKVDDWERKMRQSIRERLFGADTVDPTIHASVPDSAEGAASQALEELKKNLGPDSDALKSKALKDPGKLIPNIDTNVDIKINEAELVKATTTKGLAGSLNATAWLAGACDVKNFMTAIKIGAAIYRERALARYAGVFLVAADQMKDGTNVTGNQVNALMLSINEMEKSGLWQRITNVNPKAKITTQAKYSLDLTKQGGGGALFVQVSDRLDAIPGGGTTCKVVTNIFFQIGATVVTIAGSIFTGGGVSVASAAASATVSASIAVIEQIMRPMAIQMLAGMTVTGDEPDKDKGDAIVTGGNIIFNNLARQNGGRPLSAKQAFDLDQTIATERIQEDRRKGLAWQFINLDNPRSLLAQIAFKTPSSLPEATSQFSTYLASINPFAIFQNLLQPNGLLARFSAPVIADAAPLDDPMGVTQYGLTDEELDQYPDSVANEKYILSNPDLKQQFIDFQQRCLIGEVINPEDQDLCRNADALHTRFRLYHIDLGLAGGIEYMSGSTDQLPNDDYDGSDNTTNALLPAAGDSKTLAAEVLKNTRITYTTTDARQIMEKAARGEQVPVGDPGRCSRPDTYLSSGLLKLMLALGQQFSYGVGYITNGCHSQDSIHYIGGAMDVNTINGKEADGVTALDRQFAQAAFTAMDQLNLTGSGIGEKQCMGSLSVPNGMRYFDDSCNHLHIDVGRYN